MEGIIGQSVMVFIILSALSGFLTYLAAKSCAFSWKCVRMALLYTGLIVIANRFLLYGLRGAEFFNLLGLVITAVVLGGLAYGVYRYFKVEVLLKQYPWLYERTSLFTCNHKVNDPALVID